MTNHIPAKAWPALIVWALLFGLLVPIAVTAKRATVTHMGSTNVPHNYAAATRQPGRIDFERGAVLLLTRHKRSVVVKVTDFCSGSGCQDLDLSIEAFDILGTPSAGVMRVGIECGRGGRMPMRKCLRG